MDLKKESENIALVHCLFSKKSSKVSGELCEWNLNVCFVMQATITAGLSFNELEELIPKVTSVPLEQIDANLAPLLHVPPASFTSLTA